MYWVLFGLHGHYGKPCRSEARQVKILQSQGHLHSLDCIYAGVSTYLHAHDCIKLDCNYEPNP